MILNRYIKKVIIGALLCVYSFALVKPVIPLVSDAIAHTFYKMQHIASVHYENGKYHLHHELQSAESETTSKAPWSSIGQESLFAHFTIQNKLIFFSGLLHKPFCEWNTFRSNLPVLEIQELPPDLFS